MFVSDQASPIHGQAWNSHVHCAQLYVEERCGARLLTMLLAVRPWWTTERDIHHLSCQPSWVLERPHDCENSLANGSTNPLLPSQGQQPEGAYMQMGPPCDTAIETRWALVCMITARSVQLGP